MIGRGEELNLGLLKINFWFLDYMFSFNYCVLFVLGLYFLESVFWKILV